jgi:hypothetical protein
LAVALFKRGSKTLDDPLPVRIDPSYGDAVARRARLAARSNDGETLLSLVETTTDPHRRELVLQAALGAVGPASWIDQLPERHAGSPAAWLVRGAHHVAMGWRAIGSEYAPTTRSAPQETVEASAAHFEAAERDLVHATRLAEDDPTPWSLLVSSGCALGLSFEELCNRFDEADQRARWLHQAHHHMLVATSPAHAGSGEIMLAFARDVAANAPLGSPCHDVVPLAHLERWRHGAVDEATGADVTLADLLTDPATLTEIDRAARESVESDAFVDEGDAAVARNVFALVLLEAGHTTRAYEQFVAIGDRASVCPWAYVAADPGMAFARARQRVARPDQDW